MSLLDVQNFTARIYTDENLRREFLAEPEKIGKLNNLNEKEIAELAKVYPAELNSFAESLRWKRLREVEKHLPLTKKILVADFERHFREFAQTFNPQSVKKHLEDAIHFGNYLRKNETISELAVNAAKFECSKLEFYALNKRFILRRFEFDVETGERKRHLKIWLRFGKKRIVF